MLQLQKKFFPNNEEFVFILNLIIYLDFVDLNSNIKPSSQPQEKLQE